MDLIENVKQRATAQLDSQKGRATDSITSIANAVRGSTSKLRDEQHDVLAQYVETFADQLERFSTNLRGKDMNELLDDARDFARRQPALFVGGSFALGLLAGRFLKSSGRTTSGQSFSGRNDSEESDYSESYPRSTDGGFTSTAPSVRQRKAPRSSSAETR
jgi:hypothetical protein